jgi:tellurite resistance protein
VTGFLENLTELYREQLERHRNRPFLRASMAACALVAMANGRVSLRDRVRVDELLETLDALRVFDPHEGVDHFNGFVDALRESVETGRCQVMEAIDAELAEQPEKASLLIRICLAVSDKEGGVSDAEWRQIRWLCRRFGLDEDICADPDAVA